MLECLIIGDSIAQGISSVRKECTAIVRGGITSRDWNRKYLTKIEDANTAIISLGTNDWVDTDKQLLLLRQTIKSKKVIWVMPPIKPDVQQIVKALALQYSDTVITITELSKDKVHPTAKGYKQLAEKTK